MTPGMAEDCQHGDVQREVVNAGGERTCVWCEVARLRRELALVHGDRAIFEQRAGDAERELTATKRMLGQEIAARARAEQRANDAERRTTR
jgi:hypothetical protein